MLEQMRQDREEAVKTLEYVASVWEQADASIQNVEQIITRLQPDDNQAISEEQERVLSTVEMPALLHGQVKVSLMLIGIEAAQQLVMS
jgi:hypothetical protein